MELGSLVGLFVGMLAVRIAYLAFQFNNMESLWYDYERRGTRYQLARAIDYSTFLIFLAGSIWSLWAVQAQEPDRLVKVFVAWLGCSLLARLQVHRFPRLNRPGAYAEAKLDFAVHVLMALLGAVVATAVTAIYFWWRG
jgi:predicted membrane channel-forming protein YqfA (hemolysin III family)